MRRAPPPALLLLLLVLLLASVARALVIERYARVVIELRLLFVRAS